MYFEPFNRHLLVDIVEEKEKKAAPVIVLPSDYEKPIAPYAEAIVIGVAPDSKFYDLLEVNDRLLIERRMLHKIEIDGSSFYLVLENYVFGRINK